MRCTKCGKEIRQGDAYCSGCGQKIMVTSAAPAAPAQGKKSGGCLVWVLVIAAIIFIISNRSGKPAPEKKDLENAVPATTQSLTVVTDTLPAEPYDGDILEDSDYPDGTPRRRVGNYTDKYITDYRPDGTMLRDVILYYSEGSFAAKRVTNFDEHGTPTDTTEKLADGTLWLYTYCDNTYDPKGRPAYLIEYNRMGYVLSQDIYVYNEDGSYCMNWEEYRGPVYEYDFETNPEGETSLFAYGYTTFDAYGNVIDQMIYEASENEQ